jgi:hypothetical protein
MLDLILISVACSLIHAMLLVGRWYTREQLKHAVTVVMQVSCLILADSWYRGWYAENSTIIRYLIDNGWSNESWPPCCIDYLKHIGKCENTNLYCIYSLWCIPD